LHHTHRRVEKGFSSPRRRLKKAGAASDEEEEKIDTPEEKEEEGGDESYSAPAARRKQKKNVDVEKGNTCPWHAMLLLMLVGALALSTTEIHMGIGSKSISTTSDEAGADSQPAVDVISDNLVAEYADLDEADGKKKQEKTVINCNCYSDLECGFGGDGCKLARRPTYEIGVRIRCSFSDGTVEVHDVEHVVNPATARADSRQCEGGLMREAISEGWHRKVYSASQEAGRRAIAPFPIVVANNDELWTRNSEFF
jgi:hypothetical protein